MTTSLHWAATLFSVCRSSHVLDKQGFADMLQAVTADPQRLPPVYYDKYIGLQGKLKAGKIRPDEALSPVQIRPGSVGGTPAIEAEVIGDADV